MIKPLLLPIGLLLCAGVALADVPDPHSSTAPQRVVFCPQGDLSIEVIVRNFAGHTMAGSSVVLAFDQCFTRCTQELPEGFGFDDANKKIYGTSNIDGRCVFAIKMGGTCAAADGNPVTLTIYADGLQLTTAPAYFMSPDQNGDLVVDSTDEAMLAARIQAQGFPNTALADLNGDGVLDTADHDVLVQHLGHACDDATGTRRSTWGELKLRYR